MNNKCKQCEKDVDWSNSTICVKCGVTICDECSMKGNFKCEKCVDKKQINIPDVIRRSSIEDYKSCPYYFKLHVIDGNEPTQNVLARLGSDLHDLYEQVQRNRVSLGELQSVSKGIIDNIMNDYPNENRERLEERTNTCNESFTRLFPALTNKAIAFEERIEFEIAKDLPKVTIAYDRLEEDENGNLHIVDWKTGKVMSGKKLTTDLQPALYLQAVKERYGKMPKSFKLIYVGDVNKKGEYKERIFTSIDDNRFVCTVGKKEYVQDIQEQLRVVKKLFAQIKQGHFSIPEKPDYFMCKMCDFREKGMCQGVGQQEWLNINKERDNYGW